MIPFRGEESSFNHLKVMGDLGQIVPMKWDCRDKDSIRRACEYSNVIINLTGRRWDTRNFTQKQVHVEAAKNIAEVAKELGVERFIHVSALGADISPSDWGKTKVRPLCLSDPCSGKENKLFVVSFLMLRSSDQPLSGVPKTDSLTIRDS